MSPRRPAWLDVLAAGFLPGALAGTLVGGLLFFLNPALPFAPGPVARGLLFYGALLGTLSLVLALPWLWRRPRRARRFLPWGLTAALALAALLDWTHASYYAYFLPSGINERLIRAALWLSLAALICFYTALLHSLHRRRYGRRSRTVFAVLALLSVGATLERRSAFRPTPPAAARPPVVEAERRPLLLVVGLGAATLDAVLPLAGEGRLPFFTMLLQQGAYGRLETLSPHRPDALWLTLGAGKYPSKHGVMGSARYGAGLFAPGAEVQLLPVGIGFRSWGALRRRAAPGPAGTSPRPRAASALWEVLPRLGVSAGAVGWPASAPASPATLFTLSDLFFRGAGGAPAALPDEIAERARLFRVAPEDLDPEALARFGPAASGRVRPGLAQDLWRESLTFFLLEQHPEMEALFVVLPGLEGVSRDTFGAFSAVSFEGARARVFHEARQGLAAYYEHLDGFLAALWERTDGPRLLAVVSPYGVATAGPWGRFLGEMSRQAALGGRTTGAPDGVLLLYGEGIRPGTLLARARLADVVPTLLYGLGFPVARDFDGEVLTAAFDRRFLARHPLTFLPSYEAPAER